MFLFWLAVVDDDGGDMMCSPPVLRLARVTLAVLLILVLAARVGAQDLDPRAFSPTPVGLNVAAVGYSYSDGNIFFDQSLPVEDATGRLHAVTIAYLRTLNFFGASAKLKAVIPFAWGDWEGLWMGEPASTSRRGLADPAIGLTVDFIGVPALEPKAMRKYREGTVVGASLMAVAPLGQYSSEKLINLGSNRWAFRTRLGASQRLGRLIFEVVGAALFFTKNPDAYGGVSIRQDPILSMQFNAVYHTRPGFWVGVGFGYGEGGQTTVDGQEKDTHQVNKRLGATLVYPLNRRNSLKLVYVNSLSAAIGADFNRVGLSWLTYLGG
jgi:hypothetical protein